VPLEDDIELVGFGFYRHSYDSVSQMRLNFKVRVHDENDSGDIVLEKQYDEHYFEYSEMEPDENKIFKYNFVERKQFEPIIIRKGQHAHVTHSYYHPSTSERFWYGTNGDKFADAPNMDKGVFAVKPSHYYSSYTTLEMGQIPGLLFKFVQ
jgi:hypothetical protein